MAGVSARSARQGLVVYRLLREHPEWGVDDLAAGSGLSSSEVRTELDELVRAGLIRPGAGQAPFHVTDPELGLVVLAERARQDLVERAEEFEQTRARLQSLLHDVAAHAAGRVDADTDEVVRPGDVAARLEVLVRRSTSGLRVLLPAGAPAGPLADGEAPAGETPGLSAQAWWFGDHGSQFRLPVRLLIPNDALEDPATRAFLVWAGESTTVVRGAETVPLPAVLCDADVVLLPVDPRDVGAGALVTRRPAVARAVAALFESVWAVSTPLAGPVDDGSTGPEAPDPAEPPDGGRAPLVDLARLVRLLGTGAKDESIARSLGVSLRTVQRAVADLQADLGASTRFQAGVLAARRGLADTP